MIRGLFISLRHTLTDPFGLNGRDKDAIPRGVGATVGLLRTAVRCLVPDGERDERLVKIIKALRIKVPGEELILRGPRSISFSKTAA